MDPIWQTRRLSGTPDNGNFPDAVEQDLNVSLEEPSAKNAEGKLSRATKESIAAN